MGNFEDKARDALHSQTEVGMQDLKKEIWVHLDQELFSDSERMRRGNKKVNAKKWGLPLLLAAAAALIIGVSLQTGTGAAVVKGIKDMFAPEKQVIQNIEGTDEKIDVNLNEGTGTEYIIYIDEARYKMSKGEEADLITTREPLPEKYPEVSMEIRQATNEKPEIMVEQLKEELKMEFPELRDIEEVEEPVEGFKLHGINGSEWDSRVVNAYVISNGKEGSFVITEHYFLEAAEGHGARFHRMLESFEIIE